MSPSRAKKQRVTVKMPNPNPLFTQWLTEWRETARLNGSKLQNTFSNALNSLMKYPLPLETGMDCKVLNGFGDKLCQMLDDKLAEHKRTPDGNHAPSKPPPRRKKPKASAESPSQNKEYIPENGSGPFAILLTLYRQSLESNHPGFLTKSEIIRLGQKLSTKSFTKPDPNTRYTAWSSMKTLIEKKLVEKRSNPAKFNLTEEGKKLAEKLDVQHRNTMFDKENDEGGGSQAGTSQKSKSSLSKHSSTSSNKSAESVFESVIFAPNTFEIILLVDTMEVGG